MKIFKLYGQEKEFWKSFNIIKAQCSQIFSFTIENSVLLDFLLD